MYVEQPTNLMQKLLHILSFAVTGFIGYCLLVLQSFPILHDFPEWMYQGWIFSKLISGSEAAIVQNFELVSHPVPNSISQLAMGLLNFALSPVVAGKVWLGFYLVFAASLWFMVSRHKAVTYDGALNLLLTMLITLGPGFWNGYINYQLGLLFFALYIYVTLLRGVQSRLWLFFFSLLLFFSHAAVFAVFLIFNGLTIAFSADKRRWSQLIALVPSVLLLLWYTVIKLGNGETYPAQGMGIVQWIQYKAYTLAKQGPFHNFIQHDGKSFLEDLNLFYQIGFVANFLVVLCLVLWFCCLVWALLTAKLNNWYRYQDNRSHWPVTLCVMAVLVAFLFGGQNSFGVVNPGERFLIVGLLLVLMLYRPPAFAVAGLTVVCAVFSIYLMIATWSLSGQSLESYSVAKSADTKDLQAYVGDIYANSRHKWFNHRLYLYADRGIELSRENPSLLPIDLATSIVNNRQ